MRPWILWLVGGSILSLSHLILWGRIELTPTITLVELEWTITAAIGCSYSGWFLIDSYQDLRWLRRSERNGANQDAAQILILMAGVLLGVHLLFLIIGGLSMTVPSPSHPSAAGRVAGVGFTWVGQLLVVLLARVQVLRSRLRRYH